ncbi:protein-glutamate methylesterase/protein-glutamine glutaminase [Holophaga foetida]|uniref:protein-glutamate methylesterase/protein-glutamine glutaminase n=1 Tax=Holophaga foetida TaxID=35839 RepID=UPI0002474287|nr:chemotaxis response regulator protein-glutamate methylesterase [Holophaga foetida]
MDPIRVLIVDDSPFMRKALERMLVAAEDIQVVGSARDGLDALDKIKELKPDIVTLDVEMPRMDGLACLKRIMVECPLPVLMVSSLTQEGATATLEALAFGALDFIPKESSLASASMFQIQQDLQEKVRKLARSPKFRKTRPAAPAPLPTRPLPGAPLAPAPVHRPAPSGGVLASSPRAELLVIGCSTGGPKALQDLLPAIPKALPVPCLIVQHMPGTFTKPFAERLNAISQVEVKEAEHGELLRPGTVYIAPGGQHMLYRQRGPQGLLELSPEPASTLHRPSVDVMFQSVAEHCTRQVLAMILTGMGADGAKGMEMLKARGAHTLSEAEESCVVYGMPRAAFERGCVDQVAPLPEMAAILRRHFQI